LCAVFLSDKTINTIFRTNFPNLFNKTMKFILLSLGLSLATLASFAQLNTDNHNISVFRGSDEIRPAEASVTAQQTIQKVEQHFPGMMVSIDHITGNFEDIFGYNVAVIGSTPLQKALNCMSQHLADFGLNPNDWYVTGNVSADNETNITFKQSIAGHKVTFSNLKFRFAGDGKLLRIQLMQFGNPQATTTPTVPVSDALQTISQDLNDVVIADKNVDANWEWFPIPSKNGYELHPAYPFEIKGQGKNLPAELTGYVDGLTGSILYRQNNVHDFVGRTVKGDVYKQNPTLPSSLEPLQNIEVVLNSTTLNTDSVGYYSSASFSSPITATMNLQGKWAKVIAVASGNVTPSFQDTILTTGGTYIYSTTSPSSSRHVNAYYHVNRIHDYQKKQYPTFTGMDIALPTNVDVTGTCNAFYNGSSINFYAAGGGCNSFTYNGDIIYHEYGHGINDKFYNWQGAGTMNNGALNEGEADCWGMSVSHDPVLGQGSMPGNGGIIRRYDQAPKVYPQDIVGEVHADGEIIAGAWWDVSQFSGDTMLFANTFAKTLFDTPDGPTGTEGTVYHKVLISALTRDDNDNNLANGTPHFIPIVKAFARHGIYLLAGSTFLHNELPHQPANTPIVFKARVTPTIPAFLSTVYLYYRTRGGSWDSLAMNNITGTDTFTATIAGYPEGKILDYYFSLYDIVSEKSACFPSDYDPLLGSTAITIPYQFGVGITKTTGFDFEQTLPASWKIGNAPGDNATGGIWIQAKPIGSFTSGAAGSLPVQPDYDHTTGQGTQGKCLVTGNAVNQTASMNSADVDAGKTTVITQPFDISGMTQPVLEYYRWFSNDRGSNPGEDPWLVQGRDSSTTFWITIDNTRKSDYNWRRRIISIRNTMGMAGIQKLVLQFVATDGGAGPSTVEAAVDDIFFYDLTSVLSVGIDPETLKAKIYPNPTNDYFDIELSQVSKGYISLSDINGKQVTRIDLTNSINYRIPVTNVPNGIYMLTIVADNTIQSKKVQVVH
jgi:hypothetical protein